MHSRVAGDARAVPIGIKPVGPSGTRREWPLVRGALVRCSTLVQPPDAVCRGGRGGRAGRVGAVRVAQCLPVSAVLGAEP